MHTDRHKIIKIHVSPSTSFSTDQQIMT